jgi:hypothetical protein
LNVAFEKENRKVHIPRIQDEPQIFKISPLSSGLKINHETSRSRRLAFFWFIASRYVPPKRRIPSELLGLKIQYTAVRTSNSISCSFVLMFEERYQERTEALPNGGMW